MYRALRSVSILAPDRARYNDVRAEGNAGEKVHHKTHDRAVRTHRGDCRRTRFPGKVADDRKVGCIEQLPEYRRCRDRQCKQRDLVPYRAMQHIYAALFHFHSSFHTFFTNR